MFFSLLQLARTYGQRFFLKFGLHCATHQIRIILVSGVVITSLFYPALALYGSFGSPTKSISIFDALISPNSSVSAQQDLADLWTGYDSLRSRDDAVSRARCGTGRTIRVERLLVQSSSSWSGDNSALNHGILLSTLNFERKLESHILPSCLHQSSNGKCFALSPLAFWGHDREALLADSNILDKLSSSSKSVSVDGIPITPEMVLAGRSDEPTFDFANFLALTYFFPQAGCAAASSERASWLEAIQSAAGQEAELRKSSQEPTIIALEFGTNKGRSAISVFLYLSYASFFVYVFWSTRQIKSVHSRVGVAFTALVEIVVSTITSLSVCALVGFRVTMVPWELLPIVIVFVGAENMFNLVDAVGRTSVTLPVKQRIAEGLSRAGTSNTLKVVSYNAILGVLAVFSVGSIRQFCVFAIVVLVAHWFLAHTFFLVVLSIDMQRLELEELLRQDSGSGLAPSLSSSKMEKAPVRSNSTWRNMVILARKLLSGRAQRNLSLVLLLAITATLYYATMPSSDGSVSEASVNSQQAGAPRGALFRNPEKVVPSSNEDMGSDLRIWKLLNPNEAAALHLRVEAPTFLTFRPNTENTQHPHSSGAEHSKPHQHHRSFARTLRLVSWLLKIMVLPIAATTFLLWMLCLYLLKDAELLDAQQNRPEAENELSSSPSSSAPSKKQDPAALEKHVSFSTLPRAFSSDVELIATSSDGTVVVSVGLHNEVIVWNTDSLSSSSSRHISIDASDILLHSPSSSSAHPATLTSVAMDDNGWYCAVGTGAGVIAIWDIRNLDSVRELVPHQPLQLQLPDCSAGVVEMQFVPVSMPNSPNPPTPMNKFGAKAAASSSPTTSKPNSPVLAPLPYPQHPQHSHPHPHPHSQSVHQSVHLVAVYENGVVAKHAVRDPLRDLSESGVVYIQPSQPGNTIRSKLVRVKPEDRLIVAFCLDDGSLELFDAGCDINNSNSNNTPPLIPDDLHVQAGNPLDTVSLVHICCAQLGGEKRVIVVAATEAGVVSVWDGETGDCIRILDEAYGRINQLRVSVVPIESCRNCGQLPMDAFLISFSVDHVVRFFKQFVVDSGMGGTARRCSCASTTATLRKKASGDTILGHGYRSRSSSISSSVGSTSPMLSSSRIRQFASSDVSPFPVSGHGVRPRRAASEKDFASRRASETYYSMQIDGEDGEVQKTMGPGPGASAREVTRFPSLVWQDAYIVHVGDTTCERGGWDVYEGKVVGIRRKPRKTTPNLNNSNLNSSSSTTRLNTFTTKVVKDLAAQGLSLSTLERWEIWSFDPNATVLQSSSLSSILVINNEHESLELSPSPTSSPRSSSSRSSHVPRLPFTRVTPFIVARSRSLAGFGNTLGVFNFLKL